MNKEPELAKDSVLQESLPLPEDTPQVSGYDWNQGVNYEALLKTYKTSGFQATNFGKVRTSCQLLVSTFNAIFLGCG